MPWPDGLEYAAAAVNIDRGLGPVLHFGGYSYPSRYTEGYPLMLAVAWPATGFNPARLYLATLALGLLAIVAMYLLTLAVFSRVAAAVSALVLALSPVVLTYSTLVLSDVPTLAVTILAALALVRVTHNEHSALHRNSLNSASALFGLVAGFTVIIRPTNAALLVGVALCLAMVPPAGAGLRFRHMLSALTAFAVGFVAFPLWQLHENTATLGRAFASGYGWWVPEVYSSAGRTFRAAYLFGPTMPRNPHGNLIAYVTALLGLDGFTGWGGVHPSLYPMAVFVFAVVGIVSTLRELGERKAKRVIWFGLGFLIALFAVYSVYLFTDIAFLLPGAFVLFSAAGCGVVVANRWLRGAIPRLRGDRISMAAVAGVALLDAWLIFSLLSVVGSRLDAAPVASTMVPALQSIDSTVSADATIVSNISLQFLELYVRGKSRVLVGLNSLDPGGRFTDYHLHRLYEKRAAGEKSGTKWTGPIPPVVFDGAEMSAGVVDSLGAAIRARKAVYVLLAIPETRDYANELQRELEKLQGRFSLEPIEQNNVVALYQLRAPAKPRPPKATR